MEIVSVMETLFSAKRRYKEQCAAINYTEQCAAINDVQHRDHRQGRLLLPQRQRRKQRLPLLLLLILIWLVLGDRMI